MRPPFGIYLHVPFCTVRCGYCDFNTYTATELGPAGGAKGASVATFVDAAISELDLALRSVGTDRPVSTVFVGGGTPTLLPPQDLVRFLDAVRERWGLADDVEVTTEANPDSVTEESLRMLADGGFTRVSIGMQSAVPQVLATLDRTHDPANVARALTAARAAELAVSLDLIYGTPGESLEQWRTSLETALALEPDHLSAYALTVEDGTKMAARVRRGELPMPTGDDEADKYELADELLTAAGYDWYEISNWARTTADRCRHNEAYWRSHDWWGVGPGAHSHVDGERWWNLKHPATWARSLAEGDPAAEREALTAEQRADEEVLLGVRLREGLPTDRLEPQGRRAVAGLVADGLVDGREAVRGRVVLTRRGRLLADTVVHHLVGSAGA
ncbi:MULTISPECIES: radical SAM family heme chaperone HemW [Janibacter]|uniref:Heme chaperone HemW n=1 Tax=Janibacter indicus TaxID=857417 RepID=A0A1W2B8D7_9MICO|nr:MULTISPECIES: radical SAM family heme chaperone HemW [Janibacter]QNF93102.1 coproporphyrinogen III oxidase [Janibacter sp. YB324]SMC69283.1 oxygen-independent coproporphyrinogen-3 oxidase [Janibacter indicus]